MPTLGDKRADPDALTCLREQTFGHRPGSIEERHVRDLWGAEQHRGA
jgi:hypothetical protein